MQASLVDICEAMALSRETKDEITAQIAPLRERVDNYIKFFWAVSGFLVVSMGSLTWFLIAINSKVDKLPSSISARLIDQSKQSASAGRFDEARHDLLLATSLIDAARTLKSKARPSYFEGASSSLKQIISGSSQTEIQQAAYKTLSSLAAYKTALEKPPEISGEEKAIERQVTDPSLWKGATVIRDFVHGDFLAGPVVRKLSNNISVSGGVFIGEVPDASQTLDGIHWYNNVFVNMKIRYDGGEVELRDVRFINCTFEVAQNPRGLQMAYGIAATSLGAAISEKFQLS
jgi:hypothetical protein